MAYSTAKDVRRLLGDPDEEALATDLITFHQRRADGYINGKLRHLYTTPFSPIPDQVRTWAENLTAYEVLYSPGFRLRNPVDTAMVTERWQQTMAQIKQCAECKFRLDGVDPMDPTWSSTQNYRRTFGLDNPLDWEIDPDQLAEELSTRKGRGGGLEA